MVSTEHFRDMNGKALFLGDRVRYEWPGELRFARVEQFVWNTGEVILRRNDRNGNQVSIFAMPGEVERQ